MSALRSFNVFIEYIHPSLRDLTVTKGWWDVMSVSNRWRHARLIVTANLVPFITKDVLGKVYDAGKDDRAKLIPMYEDFKPTSLNRYLGIGTLKASIKDDKIKALCKYECNSASSRISSLSHNQVVGDSDKRTS